MLKKYIKNDAIRNIAEWLVAIVGALLVFVVLQKFVIANVYITGNSMEPTFNHSDKAIVLRFSYLFSNPDYRDVIAFPYKEDPSRYFIKRIIGKPGDEIDLVDYQFTVNGEILEDDFSKEIVYALGNVNFPIIVPEDSYFVLGDNRNASQDSRYLEVGCIPKKEIVGKVVLKIWPLNNIGFVGDGQ